MEEENGRIGGVEMTELFKIKSLVWENGWAVCPLDNPLGYSFYGVMGRPEEIFWYPPNGNGPYKCKSIEEAKSAAEDHYRERLREALEEVPVEVAPIDAWWERE